MHRCQYNKTWSSQANFPAANLNWRNLKTMPLSHNNTCNTVSPRYLRVDSQKPENANNDETLY